MDVTDDKDLFEAYLTTLQIEQLENAISDLRQCLKQSENRLLDKLLTETEVNSYSNPVIAGKTLSGKLFIARLNYDGGVALESFDLCQSEVIK